MEAMMHKIPENVSKFPVGPTNTNSPAKPSKTPPIFDIDNSFLYREKSNNAPLLLASFIGHRATLNDKELLKAFFRYPLMTMKIVFGIHYEALRLILKGVIYIKRPSKETSRITYS